MALSVLLSMCIKIAWNINEENWIEGKNRKSCNEISTIGKLEVIKNVITSHCGYVCKWWNSLSLISKKFTDICGD